MVMRSMNKTIMKTPKKIKMKQMNIMAKQIEIKTGVYLPVVVPLIRKILINTIVISNLLEEKTNNTSCKIKKTVVLTISKIPSKIITINDIFSIYIQFHTIFI